MVNIWLDLVTYMPSRAVICVTMPSMGARTGMRLRGSPVCSISRMMSSGTSSRRRILRALSALMPRWAWP